MTPEEILEIAAEYDSNLLYPTGMEKAVIGIVERFGMSPQILMDKEMCIKILMDRDGMARDEAVEFFEFNIIGAGMGDGTPCFATIYRSTK